jgi:hypothetical protein
MTLIEILKRCDFYGVVLHTQRESGRWVANVPVDTSPLLS